MYFLGVCTETAPRQLTWLKCTRSGISVHLHSTHTHPPPFFFFQDNIIFLGLVLKWISYFIMSLSWYTLVYKIWFNWFPVCTDEIKVSNSNLFRDELKNSNTGHNRFRSFQLIALPRRTIRWQKQFSLTTLQKFWKTDTQGLSQH